MSMVPPFIQNTQFGQSVNLPLYSVASDTVSFSQPSVENGVILPPEKQAPEILKTNEGLVQNSVLNGGRNIDPPVLIEYINARNPATGIKIYGTPQEAQEAYENAIARFVVEPSLQVVPVTGQKYLNHTRNVISAEQITFDDALIPTCGPNDTNFSGASCASQVVPITVSSVDSSGTTVTTEIGTGVIPSVNAYFQFPGTNNLPCVVVPGADPAFCGQTFNTSGFAQAASERSYRNLCRQLANPSISSSSISTNLKSSYLVHQLNQSI